MTITFGAWLILGGQVITFATLAVGLFTAIRATRRNAKAVQEVHVIMNSRLDQMMALQAKSSHAEGVKDEKDRVK